MSRTFAGTGIMLSSARTGVKEILMIREPLCVPSETICAVDPKFCLEKTVQLDRNGADLRIMDTATQTVYFQYDGKIKVLYDNFGQPVLRLKEKILSLNNKFSAFTVEDVPKEVFRFNTHVTYARARLRTKFNDAVSQTERKIYLKGDWASKRCLIYFGKPKHGGIPIAKISGPPGMPAFYGFNRYTMEISPGVDIALITIICLALDEHP